MITESIRHKLQALENAHSIQIIYACESGSRAWGFASPDSDYDVRFLYRRHPDWYLSVQDRDETLTFPIDEEDLDFSGWDIRKALRLFAKSNGSLLEWLHSPIVYREDAETMKRWRALVPEVLDRKALAAHYFGLCHRSTRAAIAQPNAKRYLYALRACLGARWTHERGTIPPVAFNETVSLLDTDAAVAQAIRRLLERKAMCNEGDTAQREPLIEAYLTTWLEDFDTVLSSLGKRTVDTDAIDAFFRNGIRIETSWQPLP